MKNAKTKAKDFIKKYGLQKRKINLEEMKNIIKSQGFDIVEYSHVENSEKVENMLKDFDLKEYSLTTASFTHVDKHNRIIFIIEGLNEDDYVSALLHEEGHIFCDHPFKHGFFDYSEIQKEIEAHEFVLSVLKRINQKFFLNSNKIVILGITALFIIGGLSALAKHLDFTLITKPSTSQIIESEIELPSSDTETTNITEPNMQQPNKSIPSNPAQTTTSKPSTNTSSTYIPNSAPTPANSTTSTTIQTQKEAISTPAPTPKAEPVPTPTPVTTPKVEPKPEPEPEKPKVTGATYYYVPNGKSYHSRSSCVTLSRSKTILSGTLSEIIAKGKSDPCDLCVGN